MLQFYFRFAFSKLCININNLSHSLSSTIAINPVPIVECDGDLRLWLEHTSLPSLSQLSCQSPPRLRGHVIRTVPLSSFACPPHVSPANMFLSVTEGRHVSLTCNVEADPLPVVTWSYDRLPLDKIKTHDTDLSVEQTIISHGIVRSVTKRILRITDD